MIKYCCDAKKAPKYAYTYNTEGEIIQTYSFKYGKQNKQ